MSFTGTLDKCKACDKTVYVVDLLSADGVSYHKSCFKCSHCKGTLVMSNYCSMDGVLYCKPHFEQLFKETGNFTKNFQTWAIAWCDIKGLDCPVLKCRLGFEEESFLTKLAAKSGEKATEPNRTPSKVSSMFCGTQDKCATCRKTAYPLEKVTVEGESYHKSCFRCSHGGCALTPSSYAALNGILYCKHHFAQLFKEKGSYNHLLEHASMKKSANQEPNPQDPTPDENQNQPSSPPS